MGQGFFSSLFGTFLVLLICYLYCYIGDRNLLKSRLRLWRIVSLVYLMSALIVSFSFSDSDFFVVSDSANYIAKFGKVLFVSSKNTMDTISMTYLDFGDNNGLFNSIINYMSYIANRNFDGVNSYYFALLSVMFGVLSTITLFRILSQYYFVKDATKFTLLFAFLSLYHFYSVVIIRDICITTFYLLSFEVVLKNFSVRGLLLLVLYMLLAWGFRLYSGLFISLFILYYVYLPLSQSKFKYILIPVFGLILAYFVFSSMYIIDQTMEELENYSEFTQEGAEKSGGLVGKLLSLPPVIKQIVLVFYSQITPLPPYLLLFEVKTPSHLYMAIMVIVYEIFWFLVSYTLFYMLLLKKYYKQLRVQDLLLLLVVLVFIIANTSHPDIRRMMPVYPIIYFYYLKIKSTPSGKDWFILTQKKLIAVYCCLLVVYNIIK